MSKPTDRVPDYVDVRQINWGDADGALMAYTGRFLDFLVEAVEHWFTEFFGVSWYDMNIDMKMGTPFRHVEMDFVGVLTPRDKLETEVRVSRVGTTSISCEIAAYGVSEAKGRRLCFTGRGTIVFVKWGRAKGAEIPKDFRDKLAAAGFVE